MTVAKAYARWSDGCSERCRPPAHDLLAHEQRGYERGYTAARAEQAERTVRTGNLVVELRARRVWVDGAEITAISRREWDLLAYLAERLGQWRPNDEIVSAIWGPDWLLTCPYGARGLGVASGLMRTNTDRLRRRLGSAGALISASGRGRGNDFRGKRRLEEVEPAPDLKGGDPS